MASGPKSTVRLLRGYEHNNLSKYGFWLIHESRNQNAERKRRRFHSSCFSHRPFGKGSNHHHFRRAYCFSREGLQRRRRRRRGRRRKEDVIVAAEGALFVLFVLLPFPAWWRRRCVRRSFSAHRRSHRPAQHTRPLAVQQQPAPYQCSGCVVPAVTPPMETNPLKTQGRPERQRAKHPVVVVFVSRIAARSVGSVRRPRRRRCRRRKKKKERLLAAT